MNPNPVSGDNHSNTLSTTIPKIEDLKPTGEYDHMADVVFKNRLDVWVDKLGNFVSYAFMVSVAISFYEIISRYFFDSPTIWVHETTIMICALCMAYGGTYCLARDSHIRIRMLYDAVGHKGKRVLDIINGVLSLFYCLLIAYAAFILAEKSLFNPLGDFRLETTGSAWDPIYPAVVKTGLFLVLVTMTVQSLLHLIQAIFSKPQEA
jgi:TRAP-type C4-dicarboxylate transport system permease small subunit